MKANLWLHFYGTVSQAAALKPVGSDNAWQRALPFIQKTLLVVSREHFFQVFMRGVVTGNWFAPCEYVMSPFVYLYSTECVLDVFAGK